MSSTFCSYCGSALALGATFCPACGKAVPGTTGAPPAAAPTAPLGSVAGTSYWPQNQARDSTQSRAVDREGLSLLRLASVIGLVGAIAGLLEFTVVNPGSVATVAGGGTGGTSVSLSLPAALFIGAGLGLALTFLELVLILIGFRRFREGDPAFRTPATLAILAIVGFALLILGIALVLEGLVSAINCAGSGNPITSSCIPAGTLLGGLAALGIGGIIALIGYIGILLGIWRMGTRFNNSLFKVAAILLIIPYVQVVGSILILVGTTQEMGKR